MAQPQQPPSPQQISIKLPADLEAVYSNFAIINPKYVWDAILDEKPYPVKMLFFISSNPLLTRGNAREVRRALEKVDFMAVADFFHTPPNTKAVTGSSAAAASGTTRGNREISAEPAIA